MAETFKLNERVKIIGKNIKGKVAFIGKTHFTDGILYGIVLDDAKGRHSGTVSDVCYFKCPENHGTFVRACQLERDSANSSNKHKEIKVIPPRPKYPNYLTHRMKCSSEQSACQIKSKENIVTISTGTKQSAVLHKDFEQKAKPKRNENYSKFAVKEHKLDHKELARRSSDKLSKVMTEMTALKNELNCRNQQLGVLQGGLSRLKSCLRWNKKFTCNSNLKDVNLKRFIGQEIDFIIKNMEDTISTVDIKQLSDFSKGDASLKEQNNFLFQHVLNLEKQTEVLMETMLRIRSILLNQKKKNPSDQKCSNKKTLTSKLDPVENNAYEYSSKGFSDGDVTDCDRISSKTIPRELEALIYNQHLGKSGESSSEHLNPNLDLYIEMKDERNRIKKLNRVKQENNQSSFVSIPDTKESENLFSFSMSRKSLRTESKTNNSFFSKKNPFRYEPYSLNLSNKREKVPSDTNQKSLDNITREFEDFINDIMAASNQSNESQANSKDFATPPLPAFVENAIESNVDPYESDSDTADGILFDSRKEKSHKVLPAARGKVSVIRRKPLRKKTVYSTRVVNKKGKISSHEKVKEQD